TVGFALTILQRRLASSPEAIYQSLRRRREKLESRLRELELLHRGGQAAPIIATSLPSLDSEDLDDLDDAPDNEVAAAEEEILDQATAARSIAELRIEIETLKSLESQALAVRRSGTDTKWCELASLLSEIFTPAAISHRVAEPPAPYGSGVIAPPTPSAHQKLVIFTEHRDTLNYLEQRTTTLLGRKDAVVIIHGGIGREERLKVQESFKHDPEVQVLLATDAAGEGINLQRAHLMVNYDLPWNPNRLEQRFGRIHRIGQTEVCHLWNLVAEETREGDVYRKLLEKIELARQALGGQVFDVLGKLQFEGKSLRELLIEAIRHGERPEVQAYLSTVLDTALDHGHVQDLLEERALAHDAMDTSRVQRIREDMERADARRLQPHYIESFFHEAFKQLGGTAKQREPRRFEISHVPAPVRNQAAVKERLTKEITYWDHRAEELKLQEQAGKPNAKLNSGEARKRADLLQGRLQKRLEDLKLEAQISPLPPVILGGLLVVPIGLIKVMTGQVTGTPTSPADTQISAARARAVVMDIERSLGFDPTDREFEKLGYDIESRIPGTGKLRFIEVKGRVSGAPTITVTRNEILYSLNKPDEFILAIVEFTSENTHRSHYLRQPFRREPDFGVTSVNYDFAELLARAEAPG
ncbi:MAG: uncharacterized protein DUF3883, partial [Candidatus Accumulibacter regalis]